jgi:hypothetical protein
MALRMLLVSVAVGLGADLPNGDEVSAWVRAGQTWLEAQLVAANGEPVVTTTTESPSAADREFAGIVEEMADSFSADLARLEAPSPAVSVAFETGFEDENWTLDPALPAMVEPAPAPIADDGARPGRLDEAVRLTMRAASAWADVLGVATTQ